jgi:hypothetical protein
MDAVTGQWLYFRVLGEPNPAREGQRLWRRLELATRAAQLSGADQNVECIGATLGGKLAKKGLAERVCAGPRIVLWQLTAEVRRAVTARLRARARAPETRRPAAFSSAAACCSSRSAATHVISVERCLTPHRAQGLELAARIGVLRDTPAPTPAASRAAAATPAARYLRSKPAAPPASVDAWTQADNPLLPPLVCTPRTAWELPHDLRRER